MCKYMLFLILYFEARKIMGILLILIIYILLIILECWHLFGFRIPARQLYVELRKDQWPIVYCPSYNISFCGLENCHPFDSKKWGRVFKTLQGYLAADIHF